MKPSMKPATICLVLFAFAVACHKKGSNPPENTGIPGVYNVRGTIATRTYPEWPNEDNLPASYDTVAWDTTIQVVQEVADIFRFFGLGYSNMDRKDGPDCPFIDECGFFGTQHSDTLNFVAVTDPGGETGGSCRFAGDSAFFLYYYNYRNITKTYSLSGKRR